MQVRRSRDRVPTQRPYVRCHHSGPAGKTDGRLSRAGAGAAAGRAIPGSTRRSAGTEDRAAGAAARAGERAGRREQLPRDPPAAGAEDRAAAVAAGADGLTESRATRANMVRRTERRERAAARANGRTGRPEQLSVGARAPDAGRQGQSSGRRSENI